MSITQLRGVAKMALRERATPDRAAALVTGGVRHVRTDAHRWGCRNDRPRHEDRQRDAAFHRRRSRDLPRGRVRAARHGCRVHDRRAQPPRGVNLRRCTAVAFAASLALTLAAAPVYAAKSTGPTTPAGALVLYDTTGPYGWLGELYAIQTDNLASHFGAVKAEPVASYTAGQVNSYNGVIYIGSTYDEPLPTAFLDDVLSTSKPVIWASDNIWELSAHASDFGATYGWTPGYLDQGVVTGVRYKGVTLTRDARNGAGTVLDVNIAYAARVQTLATAV